MKFGHRAGCGDLELQSMLAIVVDNKVSPFTFSIAGARSDRMDVALIVLSLGI
jgi:hypothetical protein